MNEWSKGRAGAHPAGAQEEVCHYCFRFFDIPIQKYYDFCLFFEKCENKCKEDLAPKAPPTPTEKVKNNEEEKKEDFTEEKKEDFQSFLLAKKQLQKCGNFGQEAESLAEETEEGPGSKLTYKEAINDWVS